MTAMRAKVRVSSIMPMSHDGVVTSERVIFGGVSKSDGYPADGADENNTFARFSPSVYFDMQIANPALIGKFTVGETFYVDFTPVG